ncbi:formate dehydrogenase-O subunit gamma [mine drainage metagenome]|uniref:Formate dehydrogenase-O subunit gamma n=1 Tax=mine drainage metagenome TaxID=410659 RepID=A0A1J5RTM3_9ZZZZ
MRIPKHVSWLATGVIGLVAALLIGQTSTRAAVTSNDKSTDKLGNATCLSCHEDKKLEMVGPSGKLRPLRTIEGDKFAKGVHSDMRCVACHQDITDATAPHKSGAAVQKVDCVRCHENLWEAVKKEGLTKEKERLGLVVLNIEAYKESLHARPNRDDKTHANATCDDCHDTHYFNVPPKGTTKRTEWHLTIPNVCGAKCHSDELDEYSSSIHGKEVMEKHNLKAAVCTDCHTAHAIVNTSLNSFKLQNTQQCGNCHKENLASYGDTYHGQVNKLGYSYTAKCYDCHGSHGILAVKDPKSKVSPKNRLKTCKQCHNGKKGLKEATPGFVTFSPHANAHDFVRYPQMWITSRFMLALLAGVFIYFWLHSGLWHYREYMDRKEGKTRPHIRTEELLLGENKQVRRFGPIWRLAHLIFALSVMMLVLTGMAVFYSDSFWAPVIMKALGGPKIAGLIHRISATIMLGIFFIHLIYMSVHLIRNRKTFRWFGPDSLMPRWQDFKDAAAMFKWFFGKGPRPTFDRWTYWEKFDYWAVFWGMGIIGGSGLMLAFPNVTASILPGWIFNVATLVHGEEAFLAAVFLFTVHFFNNHFRPDKFPPPDVVMFTGTVPLEEFKREHSEQYKRLVETGQLEKYLVDAPSRSMTLGSKILGLALLAIGLILLGLVMVGFVGRLSG